MTIPVQRLARSFAKDKTNFATLYNRIREVTKDLKIERKLPPSTNFTKQILNIKINMKVVNNKFVR